ncbi:MAG: hypothetical protein WBR23_01900 [Candidatus Dormiibacterota bacterium]
MVALPATKLTWARPWSSFAGWWPRLSATAPRFVAFAVLAALALAVSPQRLATSAEHFDLGYARSPRALSLPVAVALLQRIGHQGLGTVYGTAAHLLARPRHDFPPVQLPRHGHTRRLVRRPA